MKCGEDEVSESNGNGKRILSIEDARGAKKQLKLNDYITVQQAHDMVIQECAKVHEHYLQQIPAFMANMIVDALVERGLIPEFRTGPVATPEVPAVSENAGGDAAPDATTPPAEPAA